MKITVLVEKQFQRIRWTLPHLFNKGRSFIFYCSQKAGRGKRGEEEVEDHETDIDILENKQKQNLIWKKM